MCMGSAPKPPKPPPLPPPPAAPEENVQQEVGETVRRAREQEKRKRGDVTRQQLVKTSAQGLLSPASTQAQTLIGGNGG